MPNFKDGLFQNGSVRFEIFIDCDRSTLFPSLKLGIFGKTYFWSLFRPKLFIVENVTHKNVASIMKDMAFLIHLNTCLISVNVSVACILPKKKLTFLTIFRTEKKIVSYGEQRLSLVV